MKREEFRRAVAFINQAFAALAGVRGQGTIASANASLLDGKLFELRTLAWVMSELPPGRRIRLVNGQVLRLRSKPAPVVRSSPYLAVSYGRQTLLEIWCNVEFLGVGYRESGRRTPISPDYHELDIAVTWAGVDDGHLDFRWILVAIECKDRVLDKSVLRQVLGLRRELSVMDSPEWAGLPFAGLVPIQTQNPPSRLILCTSRPIPPDYDQISAVHAITLKHITL